MQIVQNAMQIRQYTPPFLFYEKVALYLSLRILITTSGAGLLKSLDYETIIIYDQQYYFAGYGILP